MAKARTYFPADQAFRIGFDMWALSLEASVVMGLRTLKIAAGGPDAQAEAGRMIGEKVEALAALQTKALTGAMGLTAASATRATLKHCRRKVRANRRRLTQA